MRILSLNVGALIAAHGIGRYTEELIRNSETEREEPRALVPERLDNHVGQEPLGKQVDEITYGIPGDACSGTKLLLSVCDHVQQPNS